MTVYVCLDDHGGMMFNKRRQSRDSAVLACLTDAAKEGKLWMSTYSAAMFDDATAFCVDDNYAQQMADADAYFVEDGTLELERADTLVVYRWNRRYPADRRFPLDVLESEWTLVHSRDFAGSSHECITEERYRRKE